MTGSNDYARFLKKLDIQIQLRITTSLPDWGYSTEDIIEVTIQDTLCDCSALAWSNIEPPISLEATLFQITNFDLSASHADIDNARATVPEFNRCYIPAGDCLVDGVFEQIEQSNGSPMPSFMTLASAEFNFGTLNTV